MKTPMKRLLCGVLAAGVLAAVPAALALPDGIAGHRYSEALFAFIDAGYLKGDGNGNFNPDAPVSLAEFAALINRAAVYLDKSGDGARNAGVSKDAWYYDDIARALNAGYLDSAAAPDSPVTLEQACSALGRILALDAGSAVEAVRAAGYLSGVDALDAQAPLTRAQAVAILHNAMPRLEGIGLAGADTVYGTAELRYADFYAGDVSSTEHYDAVTSATNSKHSIMKSIYSDFVDAETNAGGYHILGVKSVNVAVAAEDYAAYKALNPSFTAVSTTAPAQYKTVTLAGGRADYSATRFHVADTVTNARAELQTGSNWGDYQINVYDPEGTAYLRNTREDADFKINSSIQGIILETESGLKVGMEYLQSIWVQPYEVSFNVEAVNTGNAHISGWDNLPELSRLVGERVTSITYIMPDETYVYRFDGIYIKPSYTAPVSGTFDAGFTSFTLDALPAGLENAVMTVTYSVGTGRQAQRTELYSGPVEATVALDAAPEEGGAYTVSIASDNYANIDVSFPMTGAQRSQLEDLIRQADAKLAAGADDTLAAHRAEAQELLADPGAASAQASELIQELTQMIGGGQQGGPGGQGGHGAH